MRSLTTFTVVLLAGCGNLLGESSREDVAWANSPDGHTHAILSETNGGATTSFGYVVQLHPALHQGETPVDAGKLYGAVRSECSYGIDLHWLNASTLALRFESAKQIDVRPFVIVGGRRIRLVAQTGHMNGAAPCGGMAASRQM